MYPVPPRPETRDRTEQYIGTWLAKNPGKRAGIVLATKIAGPARQPHNPRHIRGAENQFDRKNIFSAIDTSLQACNPITWTCTSCTGPTAAR